MRIIESGSYFHIIFPYRPSLVERVKSIPGRRWDPVNKVWKVPISSRTSVERFARANNFRMNGNSSAPVVRDFKIPELPTLQQSIPLKMDLYPFQKQGVAYSLQRKRLIIGDQMGLGKTAQAIATITASQAFPCLVICPASLKLNWQREWHMWTSRKALLLSNQNKNTWHMFTDPKNNLFGTGAIADVFIVNYESLKKYFVKEINTPRGRNLRITDIKFKETIHIFKSVIIDESHRAKDPKTQQAKFVKGICMGKEYILALTGTPVVNKPRDLVSQLAIIEQLKNFGGYQNFVNRYCEGWDGAENLEELNWLLNKNCFYRRDKGEVLKDLPAKVRQVVQCDITTRKEYKDALADLEIYLKKYRQATDDQVARAMRGEVMVRIGILKNISARGKLNDVVDYIKDVVDSDDKIVVFVHLREVASFLKQMFPVSVTVLGEDDTRTRQINIDKFQNDPDCQIIICSIKAGGVGITLTASSLVAFVELPWHPADCDQAEDRLHRIGQANSVQCTYFLGKNTIDEWIYKLIDEKRRISNTITGARDEVETSIQDSIINLFNKELRI